LQSPRVPNRGNVLNAFTAKKNGGVLHTIGHSLTTALGPKDEFVVFKPTGSNRCISAINIGSANGLNALVQSALVSTPNPHA
jgi:hypothetical protein